MLRDLLLQCIRVQERWVRKEEYEKAWSKASHSDEDVLGSSREKERCTLNLASLKWGHANGVCPSQAWLLPLGPCIWFWGVKRRNEIQSSHLS